MARSIKAFENSLKEYLISAQADAYSSLNKLTYRYNNLKVYMDPTKKSVPHFWVSMAISAVCFGLDPLERIDGGTAAEEMYILRWAARPNIMGELKRYWALVSHAVVTENANEEEEDGLGAGITGSGIRKTQERKQHGQAQKQAKELEEEQDQEQEQEQDQDQEQDQE